MEEVCHLMIKTPPPPEQHCLRSLLSTKLSVTGTTNLEKRGKRRKLQSALKRKLEEKRNVAKTPKEEDVADRDHRLQQEVERKEKSIAILLIARIVEIESTVVEIEEEVEVEALLNSTEKGGGEISDEQNIV
jgi:hypothetical protein